jgi:hypothetical protein
MANLRDPIIRRIQDQAKAANEDPQSAAELAEFEKAPRWRLSSKWIEFECGCTAQRFRTLRTEANYDPIIFRGLPEQAVYDSPCDPHLPGLNDYVKFGGYVDFSQWRRSRLQLITGELANV